MSTVYEKLDLSEVRDEDKKYIGAYFGAALEGQSFRSCKVVWLDPAERNVSFHLVFDDGSKSETLHVPAEAAFVQDRSDQVVYDEDTGARRTVLGFVQNGVLKGLVDDAFFQKKV